MQNYFFTYDETKETLARIFFMFNIGYKQGAETSCVCVCTKSVCQFKVPKVCTVGVYST